MIIIQKYIGQILKQNDINLPNAGAGATGENQLSNILTTVFMIAAGVAVLMVIIGGLSYVLSTGDPQKAAKAKNTILYAIIGLVVAIMATTIVGFVFGRL